MRRLVLKEDISKLEIVQFVATRCGKIQQVYAIGVRNSVADHINVRMLRFSKRFDIEISCDYARNSGF